MRERLRLVDDLLRDNRTQLERLLDLYLTGDFPRDILTERKTRLEMTIGSLERERAGISTHLGATTLTPEQIRSLQDFAREVAVGLIRADTDFAVRREVVEMLSLDGKLAIEEGQQVLYLTCAAGRSRIDIVNPKKDEERARGATLVCRSLTVPDLNGLRRPSLVTGGAGMGLPRPDGRPQGFAPTGWAQPRGSGVSFRGGAGGIRSE